jgi:hypothetical protein
LQCINFNVFFFFLWEQKKRVFFSFVIK